MGYSAQNREVILTNRKNNPLRHYINKWVAMDDKDRIISFAPTRKEMLEDIINYNNYLDNFKVKVYRICNSDTACP
ncbi:MAG: hypothetical protein M1479_08535 [Actinobacteria bacterium]|nr:hypothetical protein [Actinomycetota bacterium]